MKKCPNCDKRDCILDVAFLNCERYGDNTYIVECPKCKTKLEVSLNRTVEINNLILADKKAKLSF